VLEQAGNITDTVSAAKSMAGKFLRNADMLFIFLFSKHVTKILLNRIE